MTTSFKVTKKTALLSLCAVIVIVIVIVIYGYSTNSSNALAAGLKRILPAVIIDGNTLSIADVEENLQIMKRLEPQVSHEFANEQLVKRVKAQILAADLWLEWQDKIPAELSFYKADPADKKFIKYVVEPRVVEASLKIHYNADYRLNTEAYKRAEKILSDILNGADFDSTAHQESDDKVTAQLGGDLGFFKSSELLPELEEQIKQGPQGSVQRKLFTSRLGYHIVWPVETAEKEGQTYWHAKHILILSTGFDKWLDQQISKYSVWKIN